MYTDRIPFAAPKPIATASIEAKLFANISAATKKSRDQLTVILKFLLFFSSFVIKFNQR